MDPREPVATLRIVFAGPQRSGKTTSLQALSSILGGEVFSPGEVNGRTVFFDWYEVIAGQFEGAPLRCQVVAIPGQDSLSARRRFLLEQADSVVFVGDTTAEGWPLTLSTFKETRRLLAARPLPVGIVFQANFRDGESVVPLEELREALGSDVSILETVASSHMGVQGAFVFGVRLAIEHFVLRRQEQTASGLAPEESSFEDGNSLLQKLAVWEQEVDVATFDTADLGPSSMVANKFLHEISDETAIRLPVASPTLVTVLPGKIWPDVTGLVYLREALQFRAGTVNRGPFIDLDLGRWRLRSPESAKWEDLDVALGAFQDAKARANLHSADCSAERCLFVARDGKSFRLWQGVETGSIAVAYLSGAFRRSKNPKDCARSLWDLQEQVARYASVARSEMAGSPDDLVVGPNQRLVFGGFLSFDPPEEGTWIEPGWVEKTLQALFTQAVEASGVEGAEVLEEFLALFPDLAAAPG